MIFSIDPGPRESGYILMDGANIISGGVSDNESLLLQLLGHPTDRLAIEMIASYGMPVGEEVFQTCVWVGRFIQVWWKQGRVPEIIYRKDVKMHLCGTVRAKDANIRQRIIDIYGGQAKAIGNKKDKGPLYHVKSHVWAALAVSLTAQKIQEVRY